MKTVKIGLHSDLHLELQKYPNGFLEVDVPHILILAGDIGHIDSMWHRLLSLINNYPKMDVVYVAGNHEFYSNQCMKSEIQELKEKFADEPRIHFLNRDIVELHGIRFVGCTGWSEMLLFGKEKVKQVADIVGDSINDFLQINFEDNVFTPDDCIELGKKDREFLEGALKEQTDKSTIVVTHFSPGVEFGNLNYPLSEVSAYFSNTYEDLISNYQPDFWCFGHTHFNIDTHSGKTKILSNQKGYGRECEKSYDPNYIFDLPLTYQAVYIYPSKN